MTVSLSELEQIVRSEWCAETAWIPSQWSPGIPAAGQCFSTAYVIKTLFGGEIVHAEILPHAQPKQRHSWNRLSDGSEVDLTREQLSAEQTLLPCELPEELVWSCGGKQAELLLQRVLLRLRVEHEG